VGFFVFFCFFLFFFFFVCLFFCFFKGRKKVKSLQTYIAELIYLEVD